MPDARPACSLTAGGAPGPLPRVVRRLAAGQCRAHLVGESDGDEPLLRRGMRVRGGSHQEPALEQAARLDEQFGIRAVRQALEREAPWPASGCDPAVPLQPGGPADPRDAVLETS